MKIKPTSSKAIRRYLVLSDSFIGNSFLKVLPFHGEGNQHIARHAAALGAAGGDEQHAARDDRSADIHRAAAAGDSVYRFEVARGVVVPNDLAVGRGVRAQ